MERKIIFLRINEFPVAVERLRDSSLRSRPVAVCSRYSPKAPVLSASKEAKSQRVYAGMPISEAVHRCPGLVVIPPDKALYRKAADKIVSLLNSYSPLIEPGHTGQFFIDITGTSRIFGAAEDTAFYIRKDIIRKTDLSSTIGIASNKLVSSVAGKIIQSVADLYAVPTGSEASFMAPLKSYILPAVKKPADRKLLYDLNIRFVHQLASMPVSRLSAVFGKRAYLIYSQAMGIDNSPVRPPLSKPFVFVDMHVEPDTNDQEILFAILLNMLSTVCFKIRRKNVRAKTIWLYIKYCDSVDAVKKLRLKHPMTNEILLYPQIKKLFTETAARRQRISYISFTFTDITAQSAQMDMFENGQTYSKEDDVVRAMDIIKLKFGDKIEWGHTLKAYKEYPEGQNSYFLTGKS